ncbi:MAG TPA: DUF5317 family protein [Candidatus Limnocylindrales bacterium]|nr:DUF5317 family protein [Candidatus Limnocylindrales bacterium]
MFLFFAVIAGALLVAVLTGGDVRRLSQVQLVRPELLIAAFGLKIALALIGLGHFSAALALAPVLNVAGSVLLLGVVWLNRHVPGALIFGIGLSLNLVAVLAFGGRMPVLLPHDLNQGSQVLALLVAGTDPIHLLLRHPQGLWFLGDVFVIPSLNGHYSVVSAGDLLMAGGIAWLILRSSLRRSAPRPAYRPTPSA